MSESNGANGSGNGAARRTRRSASRSSASATAPTPSSRASTTTRTPIPAEEVPGLMHVDLGGYHVRDVEFVAAFDIDSEKVGKDLSEAIWSGQNDTIKFADVPQRRGQGPAGHDPRRPRQVPEGEDHQSAGRNRRRRRDPQGDECRRARLLPAGRLRGGDQVVRRAGPEGRGRLRQLPARVHRPRGLLGQALRGGRACRSSATTSSPRSGRRSSTASSPASSTTAACAWSGPASSTSAATWTSSTCSSASGSTRRRSRRPTPSPRSWVTTCRPRTSTSAPRDYVAWLTDRKWAHIRLEGKAFGDVPLTAELKLEVWDSPNSAGVVIDACG